MDTNPPSEPAPLRIPSGSGRRISPGSPGIHERRQSETCSSVKKRRAWHTLSDDEKRAYLDAEVCLMNTPSTSDLRGSKSKFDDFQAIHVLQSEIAHFVGQFLPFHRLFVYAHEQALEAECGYTEGQPYWAEEVDAGAFSKSVIFDADLGFGGDGAPDTQCIQDGPFADYMNPLGPGYTIEDHCIQRQISDRASNSAQESVLENCRNKTTFMEFWPCIEGGPHGAGHGGVGAQEGDPETRHAEIGGNNEATGFFGAPQTPGGGGFTPPFGGGFGGGMPGFARPDDVPAPEIIGDPGNETTLTHLLEMYGVVEDRTIAEVMDIAELCYEYD
ncbi:unnamed protein product [Parascedosporium putredinis]|uniref:Tyrosinase copper-binding domain-containing protein n=1 Tax=Parascedosporium putredinis TaxID=1442378 RepID=A0A9P1GYI6_9PEZI|nr:unnamed protein product [Parascedosporium putredinis]CAI7990775.1 unnamed protein product [Parascedosporium putredinis]